ncbi:hypothetical protein AAHB53_28190 [Niallia circulans]
MPLKGERNKSERVLNWIKILILYIVVHFIYVIHVFKFPVFFGIVTLLMIIVIIALILGWAVKSIRGDYD